MSVNPTPNLECPILSIADIFALLDDRLAGEALEEVQAHISNCNPCQALATEVGLIYKTRHKFPSRSEQLLYLKNVLSPLQTLLDEPAYKFDKKFRAKTNKRFVKLERKLKRHFQDELSVNTQGLMLAFIETNKTEILANAIAPLQAQVKDLQAQVNELTGKVVSDEH